MRSTSLAKNVLVLGCATEKGHARNERKEEGGGHGEMITLEALGWSFEAEVLSGSREHKH